MGKNTVQERTVYVISDEVIRETLLVIGGDPEMGPAEAMLRYELERREKEKAVHE